METEYPTYKLGLSLKRATWLVEWLRLLARTGKTEARAFAHGAESRLVVKEVAPNEQGSLIRREGEQAIFLLARDLRGRRCQARVPEQKRGPRLDERLDCWMSMQSCRCTRGHWVRLRVAAFSRASSKKSFVRACLVVLDMPMIPAAAAHKAAKPSGRMESRM